MKRQSCPSPISKVTVEQVASPGAEHRLGRAYELILRAAGQADQANEAGSEKAVKPEKSGDGYSGHSPDHSTPEQGQIPCQE